MTQLSVAPLTHPHAISPSPATSNNPFGLPPQPAYSDNTIDRMVQREQYAHPYNTNPHPLPGSSAYPLPDQNIYSSYANVTAAYPGVQPPFMYSDPALLQSPDSIYSIESPPLMMQQGPHTMSFYPPVNRASSSPEKEVPFSQILARNSSPPQSNWAASGSPTNPNYTISAHLPASRSTTANNNGAATAQQIQAVRPILKSI